MNDKFKDDGQCRNVNKGRFGRPRRSVNEERVVTVLQADTQYPRKSLRQCSHEVAKNPLTLLKS
jgi:hypothetical protein